MINFEMQNVEVLSDTELQKTFGGNPLIEAAKWLGSYFGGKIVDELVEYAMDPDRQVDINHARNGGWQM